MYWKFYKLLIIKSILIKSFWESRTLFSKRVLAAGGIEWRKRMERVAGGRTDDRRQMTDDRRWEGEKVGEI